MILPSLYFTVFKNLGATKILGLTLMLFSAIAQTKAAQQPIVLVENGKSFYQIVIPVKASDAEVEAAAILQDYLEKVSGVRLTVLTDHKPSAKFELLVGKTNRGTVTLFKHPDEFLIKTGTTQIFLDGNGIKGPLYAVYSFLEKYLACYKYAAGFEVIPKQRDIVIPSGLRTIERPSFNYREVYYRDSRKQRYLDWHKLHRMDDTWGLWVHTFDKLLPAKVYFKTHPQYFALVDGKRKESQLCLSNPAVFEIVCENLRAKINDSPDMKYWSVSQNDDPGYCECNLCAAVDRREGGPQGSILKFVNKVAAQFPDRMISTLAYSYSQKAPLTLKPAKNVLIMLCTVDCNRAKSIVADPGSGAFRRDLKNWSEITKNLFIWDYNVQFTNYVSPFPNFHVLQANLQFFKANKVSGVFLQGAGDTSAEFSELRGYLLAKLSWNPDADVSVLTSRFLADYYGNAAPFIKSYLDIMQRELEHSGDALDIYGNPIQPHRSYLSPVLIDRYGNLFDSAEKAVVHDSEMLAHVRAARLPLEYAVLQQAKFFGIEKHGAFIKNDVGVWEARNNIRRKVTAFVKGAVQSDITLLSEGGLSPEAYGLEWDQVFMAGPKDHLGLNAKVIAVSPFNPDYANKGARTLTDGSRGYLDYQYNWLGWLGNDMEVIIDLEREVVIQTLSAGFLEDQRHWAFVPTVVTYAFSADGKQFSKPEAVKAPHALYENYEQSVVDYTLDLNLPVTARYVKVKAKNLRRLPQWRSYKNRKPWLFIDEIMIR